MTTGFSTPSSVRRRWHERVCLRQDRERRDGDTRGAGKADCDTEGGQDAMSSGH
jgi:hypothetical protein